METVPPIINEITGYLPPMNAAQQKAVLTVVKTFAVEKDDWWDEISSDQQEAIGAALAEMESGKVVPHGEVVKKYGRTVLVL